MKRAVMFCATLVIAIATGFASNVKKEYPLGSFTGINLQGPTKVFVTHGKSTAVKAEGPQELINKLEVFVDGTNLVIRTKKGESYKTRRDYYVQFFVEIPSLDQLTLSGSGDMILRDKMEWGSDVTMSLSGSGDLKIGQIKTQKLNIVVNGSGDIEFKNIVSTSLKVKVLGSGDIKIGGGVVQQADYNVVGSGDIKAQNLQSENVNANITGSGDIRCYAKKSISGRVFGSGDVVYGGKPSGVNVSKNGFSSSKK